MQTYKTKINNHHLNFTYLILSTLENQQRIIFISIMRELELSQRDNNSNLEPEEIIDPFQEVHDDILNNDK